jgi:hypothetical protein
VSRIRPHLTYANVMATIAVFVALGGSSYAAISVTGRDVKNSSLTYKDLKRNTLGGSRIQESRLGTVPRAKRASTLSGFSARRLLQRCPAGTTPSASVCVETTARAAESWSGAAATCARYATPSTPGRRLATVAEVSSILGIQGVSLAPGGELTGDIVPNGDGQVAALALTGRLGAGGTVTTVPDSFEGRRGFRCAMEPLNG